MDDLKEKIARLPAWVREHIKYLEMQPESLVNQVVQLRKRVEYLEGKNRKQSDQIEAMVAMFQCAAKGENEIAKAVQRIVEDFLIVDSE